jgi:serine acetyltransferase
MLESQRHGAATPRGRIALKTSAIDYVLSTIAITCLLALALAGVWLQKPISVRWLGGYHVLWDLGLALLLYGVLTAVAIRILLRFKPIKAGTYDMALPVFTYWKLITVLYRLGQAALLPLTPVFLKPVVEALYGARIGADVALGGVIDDPYRVFVGDGSVLGHASLVSGNYINKGELTCGDVRIGAGVTIGPNAVVFPGVEIGDNAMVVGGSFVMPGTKIPAGETWRGNPARKWM